MIKLKTKSLFSLMKRGKNCEYADSSNENIIVTQSCVLQDHSLDLSRAKFEASLPIGNEPYHLKNGDLLISSSGVTKTIGKVALVENINSTTIANWDVMRLVPESGFDPKFLFYSLSSKRDEVKNLCIRGGTGQEHLITDFFNDLEFEIPPLNKQVEVSFDLDIKCKAISKKISLLTQKLTALEEYKTALIHNAVTKGLDANGKRILDEDSLFKKVRVQDFSKERSEKVNDTEFMPLSVTKQGILPRIEGVAQTKHNDNRKKVLSGDFVINSRADRKGSSGVSIYDGSVSVISTVLELDSKIDREFAHFMFKGNDFIEKYFMAGKGIVLDLWSTNSSAMKKITIELPPINEQEAIARFLKVKTKTIENKIALVNKKIALLLEYKKSLINEAVSGDLAF